MSNLPPPPPPGPPPNSGYPVGGGPVVGLPRGRGLATAAMVCGIVGIPLFFLLVLGVVALVLGLVGASQIKSGPQPHDGLGKARAGWILGTISVGGFVAFVVAIATGAIDVDEKVAVNDLEVGQCIELDLTAPELEEVPELDCDEPHDGEVIHVGGFDESGDTYPGEQTLSAEAGEICSGDVFEDFIGVPFSASELDVSWIVPTEESWRFRDRGYTCIAITVDGSPLTESVRGSGR